MLRNLNSDQLAAMDDDELAEYQEILEAELKDKRRTSLSYFARAVEVPGVPPPVSMSDIKRDLAHKMGLEPGRETPDIPEVDYYPDYVEPARHHELLLATLQNLLDNELIAPDGTPVAGVISMQPPGSAKSTYGSMIVPAFALGRPRTNVIGVSYSQELADRFSRRVRHIVASPEYAEIMGASLKDGSTGVQNWELDNHSEYRSAGMLASVTGFRADLLDIDDPIKNREDADSEIIREKTWQAMSDALFTRLKPGGKIIMQLTRWHEDDPAGRILGEDWKGQSGHWRGTDGRNWFIINLPMLAEHKDDPLGRKHGEMLWPEWFERREIDRLAALNDRTWTSLYQQRPAPNEGSIIKRAFWRPWTDVDENGEPDLPDCDKIYLYYDTALKGGSENDFSAMTAWGSFVKKVVVKDGPRAGREYKQRHAILLGAWQERIDAAELFDKVEEHYGLMQPDRIVIEDKASGPQLIQELRRARFPVVAWKPYGGRYHSDKESRAYDAALVMSNDCIWYVPGHRTEEVLAQCAAFPYAKNDDLVDTVTMAVLHMRRHRLVEVISDAYTPEEELEIEEADWRLQKSRKRLYGSPKRMPAS